MVLDTVKVNTGSENPGTEEKAYTLICIYSRDLQCFQEIECSNFGTK